MESLDSSVHEGNVPHSYATNLCRRRPVDAGQSCRLEHGMMQLSANGESMKDLYHEMPPSYQNQIISEQGQGLFLKGGNPMYFKHTADDAKHHSILKQSRDDIGGHHVVFGTRLHPRTQEKYMHIDRVPLVAIEILPKGSSPDPAVHVHRKSLESSPTHGDFGWLRNLAANMRDEAELPDRLYPERGGEGSEWSCPLRRLAFWTKSSLGFNPLVPSPARAARLFGGQHLQMTHGTRSHPTQLFAPLTRISKVFTSNGFCFCETLESCRVKHGRASNCTLKETIMSLYDKRYRRAELLLDTGDPVLARRGQARTVCTDQLDFPFEGGVMRDGMRHTGRNDRTRDCSVIDRLPPFMYRYSPDGKISPTQETTLDQGGSCHMGPLARLDYQQSFDTRFCRTINTNYSHIVARCERPGGFDDIEMPRERSSAPTWMVEHMKTERQSCSTCSPPPDFRVEASAGRRLRDGAEVSYGVPFRWSTSRILAGDMRAALCGGNHNNTPECLLLMNVSQWTLDGFLSSFVGDVESLLSPLARGTPPVPLPMGLRDLAEMDAGRPDEDQLWDGPDAAWVACDQYNGTCYGGIPKDDWYGPNRGGVCIDTFQRMVAQGNVQSSTVGIDICNLNSDLNRLCQTLKYAQQKVFDGNCISTGACNPQVFVYTPSIYSVTNEDFVRGTVSNFYEIYNRKDTTSFVTLSNDDKICPSDDEEIDLKRRNAGVLRYCTSTQLER